MIKTSLTALATAALLAACGTVPVEAPAPAELPPAFANAQGLPTGQRAEADWWTVFDDRVLDTLVSRGLQANLDLQQAAERVQRSRALAAGARAELAPSGGIGLGALAQQRSRSEAPGASDDERRSSSVLAAANLAWEIDLFGRIRDAAAAAGARTRAVEADAGAMRLTVGAEIAQVWFALNGAREQLRVARTVIDNRRATLDLVQRRVSAGYSAPLDEARARADLASAEALVPAFETQRARASHRLAVLLGTSPSAFDAPPFASQAPRPVVLRVPEPAQWAALRPDLQAAEARLQAQALDVQAIRAEFMPRVSITGLLGFVAGSLSGLGAAGSVSWFAAPTVSLPIFDTARIEARLQAARAGQREALLAYRQQVLLATEEVETALVHVRQGQVRLAALQDSAAHAVTAEGLARTRYEAGGSDLLELLDAQRTAQHAEMALVAGISVQREQFVALQRALAARFEPSTDRPQALLTPSAGSSSGG